MVSGRRVQAVGGHWEEGVQYEDGAGSGKGR